MSMDYKKVKEQINRSKQKDIQDGKVTVADHSKGAEYITLKEGAERYCMCYKTFRLMAYEAHAVYKRNRKCIVNVKLFEEYFETFRE